MLKSWDARRDYIIPGDAKQTIDFAVEHWIHSAERAIQKRGRFAVALSGGSTPKAIYEKLCTKKLDWSKIWLFWSDERAVPPDHADSNYRMAMDFFKTVPIPPSQVFRMIAESDIEKNALNYEEKIHHVLGNHLFDLVMLGVGEDGHTASLFPNTKGLEVNNRLVIANKITEKNVWRMTLTFDCINQSFHSAIYCIGSSKQIIVPKVLSAAIISEFPSSRIGTAENKALWILDSDAASNLK
ncbi:MAG: 6-phosphogluconolactonase [Parachlamydiales bacterium]|nr:6-phosphogluconolactonase [Parachlamydiales bacterium]